jgi:hypothetical protein
VCSFRKPLSQSSQSHPQGSRRKPEKSELRMQAQNAGSNQGKEAQGSLRGLREPLPTFAIKSFF